MLFLWCPVVVLAGVNETIGYLEGLLAQGKKVAVLYVDMQTGYLGRSYESREFERVFSDQMKLLAHFSENPNVHFINVNFRYETYGPTISEALRVMKKNVNYRLFRKYTESAFKTIPLDSREGEEEITIALRTYLHAKGVDSILVTGCMDGVCVRKTATDALETGLNVTVDRDLNIIQDLGLPSWRAPLAAHIAREWDKVKEDFPKLNLTHPIEHDYCVL